MLVTDNVQFDEPVGTGYDELKIGQYVRIAVTDTGFGMAPEIVDKAVEPFFTTKEVGQGSGLGLSQVYGYVKQSGGHVDIQSEPGKGTTVALYLRRSIEAHAATNPEDRRALTQSKPDNETVLVVEDEKIVQLTTVESLRGLGYRVLTADHAPAALEILKSAEPIDFLFSDVVMPGGMNGVELAVEAIRLRPMIKVLLTSGYTRMALSTKHRLGAEMPILQKPYRAEELAAQLRTITHAA
jgi:CheY-like chemotaxis protein